MLHVIFSKWYFCPFCFHAHKCYVFLLLVFFSFSLTLFQLFFVSIQFIGIWVLEYMDVCVRAFLSISFKFSHCFWCAFGWTGVKRILFVRRLHGLAFFYVVVCWPTFWEWQQSTTSIMHTKSSVNSFWNKKSIGNFFDVFVCRLHKTLQHAHLYRRHGGVVCGIIHLKCKRHKLCVHICGTYGPKIKQSLSLKMQFHKLQYKILVCIHV